VVADVLALLPGRGPAGPDQHTSIATAQRGVEGTANEGGEVGVAAEVPQVAKCLPRVVAAKHRHRHCTAQGLGMGLILTSAADHPRCKYSVLQSPFL